MFKHLGMVGLLCLMALSGYADVINCSSVSEIRAAMASAVAGDEIVIAAGTYTASGVAVSGSAAYYYGTANGTAAEPIIIRSASASNKAVLRGNNVGSLTVLRILGDHWIVRDLEMTNGQKGLIFDNANYCEAINCEIYNTGYEAVHVRDGSDHCTIDGCTIYDTGLTGAGFGEGIYIGTDKGSWSTYAYDVTYTTVKNCVIGPNVSAEAFDIKEGTEETVVEGCTIDATGISGSNFADSFIDLKGTRSYIRCNTFIRNGASNLTKGIAVIDRGVTLSSYDHAVHDNSFSMDNSNGNILEAYGGTSGVYGWNNTRTPSGDMYNSRVTTSCCPSWYSSPPSCGSGGTCDAPTSLSTSGITTNSVTFNWGSVSGANDYDLRYRVSGASTWTNQNNLSGTSYTQSGLTASTTYEWEIRTSCSGTNSGYAAGSNFTTNAAASCNAPNSLSTSGVTSSSATFNWGSVSGANDYDLRYRESGTSTWTNQNNLSGTSYTQAGLTASTTYEWEIRTSCSGTNSSYAAGSDFTTTGGGGGGSTLVLYDDDLASGWSNYSYNGSYDLSHTTTVQVGSESVEADYSGWGAFYIRNNSGENLSSYTHIRFWVKSDGSHNMRVKMSTNNGTQTENFTTTSSWQQIEMPLSDFGNPTSITQLRMENRSSSSFTAYYDQVEFVDNGGARLARQTPVASIFPNPAAGQLTILMPEAPRLEVKLMSLSGQVLRQETMEGAKMRLDIGALPTGLYLLSVNGQWHRLVKE